MQDNKLKILFDCTILSFYDSRNGYRAGVFFTAYNLLYELQRQGHYIELYCDFASYYKFKKIKEFRTFKLIPEFSLFNKIAAIILYLITFLPPKFQRFALTFERIYSRHFYIKSKKKREYIETFDAYFTPFSPPSAEILEADIKRFRLVHDVIPLIESGLSVNDREWNFWRNRRYYTINEDDFYFTNSDYTKSDLLKHIPFLKSENIKTTLLGANDNFKPIHDENVLSKYNLNKNYIFSLCSFEKRKNLIFAIENFYKFISKNSIDDLELVLAGGIWQNSYNELYETLKKHNFDKIKILKYILDEELPSLYSNALMFVQPSLYEGFGLPVLEAMQCGCPVITSNTTSLPEVIGDAGIQINPKSDEEMISAYEKMYFDSEFRNECKKRSLERAKQFSWEKCVKEMTDFMQLKI